MSRYYSRIIGGKIDFTGAFEIEVDATVSSPTNAIRLPFSSPSKLGIDWGDGTQKRYNNTSFGSTTNYIEHIYSVGGVYRILITANLNKIYYNQFNGYYPNKIKKIIVSGDVVFDQNMQRMFRGSGLEEILDGNFLNVMTQGYLSFAQSNIIAFPNNVTLENLISGVLMFDDCISFINSGSGLTLTSLVDGTRMFRNTRFPSLSNGVTLNNLVEGGQMFINSRLEGFSDNVTLHNLINGNLMLDSVNTFSYLGNSLTLENLESGNRMFRNCPINALPLSLTLTNLIDGTFMFFNNNFSSLNNITLNNLISGSNMFGDNAFLNDLGNSLTLENLESAGRMFRFTDVSVIPETVTLSSLTNGGEMFQFCTLTTESLSRLYIKMSVLNPNSNVSFHGGSGTYDPAYTYVINGTTYNTGDARTDLVARGWTLRDGGSI